MEFLFIKKIIDRNLYSKSPDIKYNDILNYYPNKETIIEYNSYQDESNDYEFIIDIDATPLTEKEEEEMKKFLLTLKEEINRIQKVLEYLIVNIDFNKLKLPNYKIYNYDNTPKFIKNKVKANSHNFDIKKFILKNKIDKNELVDKMKNILSCDSIDISNDSKLVINYILIQILDLYNYYHKSLTYSCKLLEEYPFSYRNKEEYLTIIDNKYINITNDEINIFHHKLIKNAFSASNKYGEIINIKRNKDKNFEILFK